MMYITYHERENKRGIKRPLKSNYYKLSHVTLDRKEYGDTSRETMEAQLHIYQMALHMPLKKHRRPSCIGACQARSSTFKY